MVADTSWLRCGISSEVAAIVAEKAFDFLKAPIRRIALPPCPCPVSKVLEDVFYPSHADIVKFAYRMLKKKVSYDVNRFSNIDTFSGPY